MYCVKLFSVSWTMPLNKSQVNYLIKVYFYLKRKYLSYTNSLITVHNNNRNGHFLQLYNKKQ